MTLPQTSLKLVWSNPKPKPSKRKFRAALRVVVSQGKAA